MCSVAVIYGSETGQSQAIAEILTDRLNDANVESILYCMNEVEKKLDITKERYAVFICSSTGDGDAPENALKFYRWLHKKKDIKSNCLACLNYAFLGLGDTNYTTYGGCPTAFDKCLKTLGAKEIYHFAICDDAVGTDRIAEPWMDGLVPVLQDHFSGGKVIDQQNSTHSENISSCPQDNVDENTSTECLVDYFNSVLNIEAKEHVIQWKTPSLYCGESLGKAVSELKIAKPLPRFLELVFDKTIVMDIVPSPLNLHNGQPFPSMASKITEAKLIDRKRLTSLDAEKQKFELTLDLCNANWIDEWKVGDSIYIMCPNRSHEVDLLLRRLASSDKMNWQCKLSVCSNTEKRNAKIPIFLTNEASLKYWFTYELDIRRPISKTLLRILADYTNDSTEKDRILELCSSEGMNDYINFVVATHISIIDVLFAFKSCSPPVERLLEHLPRLQARPYSVASSPKLDKGIVRFVFSIVQFPHESGRAFPRTGLASGYLTSAEVTNESASQMVFSYLKRGTGFHLPEANPESVPLILIGPGAGVAPFLGFLDEIRYILNQDNKQRAQVERWLFFGCRNSTTDYIYREQLERFHADSILTKLFVSFSRQSKSEEMTSVKYVQDNIKLNGKEVIDLLINYPNSCVYICGDAQGMAKAVLNTFIDLLISINGDTMESAKSFLDEMAKNGRYQQDIWT